MSRFAKAMLAYLVLAILALTTLNATVPVMGRQVPLSAIALVVLGMFAFRTWIHHKREMIETTDRNG